MSIITSKPQTTRHRIIGICNGEDYQIVFSDTPGLIEQPSYEMQKVMNRFALSTFEDADIMILLLEENANSISHARILEKIKNLNIPKFLVVNKIDLLAEDQLEECLNYWRSTNIFDECLGISALHKLGTEYLFNLIRLRLPEGPKYYPKDQFTDRPERFFVTEIIREKILELYHQEIPYSVEIVVEEFKEEIKNSNPFVHIYAEIYVARKSQKAIIIGKQGSAIKKLGTESRISIESFLDKKVFLELFVKVRENWRDNEYYMKQFGYH